jgi:hypothetical protein
MPSPIDISVRANVKELQRSLSALAYRQLNFATAQALTAIAKQVQAAEISNIAHVFKQPKPFTKNSVGVIGARKDTLKATVYVRPIAAKYLEPYEEGGTHSLPGRVLFNPKNIKLDRYGQLPRGALAKLRARPDIFVGVVKTKSGPVNGVWQRIPAKKAGRHRRGAPVQPGKPGHLKLLIRFGEALTVNKRLNYQSIAQKVVARRFDAVLNEMLGKAIATAR